jgi:hypothetical protein
VDPGSDERSKHKRRRLVFYLVYCVPTGYVLAHWRGYEHPMRDALVLTAMASGGLLLAALLCTILVPRILQRMASSGTAREWQRAAYDAIVYAVPFPLGWVILKFPLPIWLLLLGYLGGVLILLAALRWLDERWLHFNVFDGFWDDK